LTNSGPSTPVPKLSYLVRDELLQGILGFFSERTGVRAYFQDASAYAVVPSGEAPAFCSMLINNGRCGLVNPDVEMPQDPDLPAMRICMGGIGHLVVPIRSTGPTGEVIELGRIITEPLGIRETELTETFAEAERLRVHPDNLAASARSISVIDRAELAQLAKLVAIVANRVANEKTTRARNLALAEAFEEVGLRANTEVVDKLLTSLVKDFTDADAAILTTSRDGEHLQHSPTLSADVDEAQAELILRFTGEVARWIVQTGYPISFPDLGGSAWCRHVLEGQLLEGAMAAVPIKLLGDGQGWWTVYYRRPMAEMEDELHRLSVLAAHTSATMGFLERLEASQEQALTDSLTGLHNRRYLLEQLERELARSVRSRYPVSLIIFDVDDFKQINDAHGHLAGDQALKHVATVLHSPLRRSSTICRFGGDEFCILVPECGPEEAQLVAERLKSEIEARPLVLDGVGSVQLRVSGGVATQTPESPPETDLFELADLELIRAKRQGKNQIVRS
jgi:diguanylate cyclase (GGDEF)-like protein